MDGSLTDFFIALSLSAPPSVLRILIFLLLLFLARRSTRHLLIKSSQFNLQIQQRRSDRRENSFHRRKRDERKGGGGGGKLSWLLESPLSQLRDVLSVGSPGKVDVYTRKSRMGEHGGSSLDEIRGTFLKRETDFKTRLGTRVFLIYSSNARNFTYPYAR